jgi:hypothetical protein
MRVRFDRNCAFVFVHECLRGWRRCRHSLNGALGTPDARKKVSAVPLPCHYGGRNGDFRANALLQHLAQGRLQAGGRGFETRSPHKCSPGSGLGHLREGRRVIARIPNDVLNVCLPEEVSGQAANVQRFSTDRVRALGAALH